jgi:hypothetical protein
MAKGDSVPSTYRQTSGLGHAPAYQVSGRPWITGSTIAPSGTLTVEFPSVSKNFTVVATRHHAGDTDTDPVYSGSLAVYFGPTPSVTWDGTNIPQIVHNHYVFIDEPNDAYTFETKCTKVHITNLGYGNYSQGIPSQAAECHGSVRIIAELTGIDDENMYALTGSGIDDDGA